jgi:hypothetical protein
MTVYRLTVESAGERLADELVEGPVVDVTIRISRKALWRYFLRGGMAVTVRHAPVNDPR